MSGSDEESKKPTIPKPSMRGASSRGGGGSRMQYRCSFCGKSQDEVQRLIAGPGAVYICDECVALCQEIISEEQSAAPSEPPLEPPWKSEPDRTITELMQDERFVRMAANRNLIFQVGTDMQIKVYQELDDRIYIFGVGPRGQTLVYRVIDEAELRELDRALSEGTDEQRD